MMSRVIISTIILQMKQSFARPMFRFSLFANPILNTILLFEMYRNSGESNFTAYVVLGSGLMAIWSCICFSSDNVRVMKHTLGLLNSALDINRERFSGTLVLIFAAPAGFPGIVMGKIIGNTLLSLVSLGISMTMALVFYQVPLCIASPVYFGIALLATVLAFVAISSIIACLLTLSRKTTLYMNCLEIPVILLCGFVYPIEVLPNWMHFFSYLLSPSWAVELLRMGVWGCDNSSLFWLKLSALLVLSAIYVIVSIELFRCIDQEVRVRASLEVS